MKEFPEKLTPQNIHHFSNYQIVRNVCYLRRDIYEFILSSDFDKDYFNLEKFFKDRNVPVVLHDNLRQTIVGELKELGWWLGYVFNSTGLLIYPSENDLDNCFWKTSIDFEKL